MKKIILILLFIVNANANIEISQNIKALYKNVNLTENQENYILDNLEIHKKILRTALKKELKYIKYLNEKNVISFILTPAGEIKDIKLLEKSGNRKLDNITKRTIKKIANKLPRPQEETNIRFIISYKIGQNKTNYYNNQINNISNNRKAEPYYQNISRGTTRFEHRSEEYIRIFETNEDGFINMSVNPAYCMSRATLLTYKGQKIVIKGMYNMMINEEIPKGKYKILFKTKKLCDVNIEYQ
jgi:hypothetical protein